MSSSSVAVVVTLISSPFLTHIHTPSTHTPTQKEGTLTFFASLDMNGDLFINEAEFTKDSRLAGAQVWSSWSSS